MDARQGRLVARRHPVEPLQRVGRIAADEPVKRAFEPIARGCELCGEGLRYLGADFITAAADGRPHGRNNIFGASSEDHLHPANRFQDDALERAAPPRVDCGDYAAFGIGKENRNAVGGLHGEEESGSAGDRSVAARRLLRRTVEDIDDVRVELPERSELQILRAERGKKRAAIRENRFAFVPAGKTEIQRLLPRQSA